MVLMDFDSLCAKVIMVLMDFESPFRFIKIGLGFLIAIYRNNPA